MDPEDHTFNLSFTRLFCTIEDGKLKPPQLRTLDVNLTGTIYSKLSLSLRLQNLSNSPYSTQTSALLHEKAKSKGLYRSIRLAVEFLWAASC